jgi:hypothetical protein
VPLLTLLLLVAPCVAARPAAAQRTISCSSTDERYRYCAANTNGYARLVDRLSDTPCIHGRTWGFDRRGVWVDRGCRGRFEVGSSAGGSGWESGDWGRSVTCESEAGRYTRCRTNTYGDVRLVRRLSKAECREGRTWGYQRNEIWVTDGCRAEFEVGVGEVDWEGSQRVVTCESNDRRYRRCRATTYGSVSIRRQLSDSDCRLNRNWGYDRSGVWVDDGCRAIFNIGQSTGGGGWRPLPDEWSGGGGSGGSSERRAREACTEQATAERFRVDRVERTRQNADGVRVDLELRLDGYHFRDAWCQYRPANGRATVYSGSGSRN